MKAIIVTGGKQYTVSEGDTIYVEKLDAEDNKSYTFDTVLAIIDGVATKIGSPNVKGAKVEAKVIKTGKAKKVNVLKFKAKKGYCRRQGHRQPYTKLQVLKISV